MDDYRNEISEYSRKLNLRKQKKDLNITLMNDETK